MYNSDLEEKEIDIERIYLDPNNPRLWTEKNNPEVSDKKIPDERIQTRILSNIESHGIEELYNSILRNGFLPLDRVVVRKIGGYSDKYVVVEGNRRIAALKMLRSRIDDDAINEDHIDDHYLETLKETTNSINVLLYKGSDSHDIAWMRRTSR